MYLPVLVLRREIEGHLGDPLSAFLFVFHSVLLPDVAQHEKTTEMTVMTFYFALQPITTKNEKVAKNDKHEGFYSVFWRQVIQDMHRISVQITGKICPIRYC